MRASKHRQAVDLSLSIWYEQDDDQILLALTGGEDTIMIVPRDPVAARGHPHLFEILAKCLRVAGVPYPEIADMSKGPKSETRVADSK